MTEFPRQFFFTNSDLVELDGWKTVALPSGWRLQLDPDTPVAISGPEAAPVIRIGHAFNLDAGPGGVGEDVSGASGAGRFVLLRWPEIATDAGGLLGLHYGERNGRQVVSSSARLAAQILHGAPREPELTETLQHRSAINYIPAPGTPYRGLRRLFHDQALDLAAFRIRHRPSPIRPLASYEAALTTLTEELCRFAGELRDCIPGKVYLPLTAGLDSRLIAASFAATGLPFKAVTLSFCGKPHSDVTVARGISRRLGVAHRTIRLTPTDPQAAERFRTHTSGAFLDWDNTHLFPGGGFRYLGRDDAMIVGSCFEVGRQQAGGTCFKGMDFANATGAAVWQARTLQPASPAFAGYLDEWIAWRRAHPLEMDFAASFYLDQRIGAWRAGIEHSHDLLPGISLCPANNPRVYSALITPDSADQVEGRLQRDAIARLAPELLRFPINPETLRCRLRGWKYRLRRTLLPRLAGALRTEDRRPAEMGGLSR